MKPNIWAVIPAAGSGQRMRQSIAKQYLSVHGKTLMEHTLAVFQTSSNINGIMVCTPPNDVTWPTLNINLPHTVGGATRANSVLNGLQALLNLQGAVEDDWVLVHDAARPCLSTTLLDSLIEQLQGDDVGGILAVPAKDTLKQSYEYDSNGVAQIDKTLDRSTVWQAQTPQMFRLGLLQNALHAALQQGVSITDEASAIEWSGHSPKLIEGDSRNIKVTTPDDLALAEFLLAK